MTEPFDPATVLPVDHRTATLVARVFDPAVGGPTVCRLRGDRLVDISRTAATVSQLLDRSDPAQAARDARPEREWDLAEVLANSAHDDPTGVRLLAPLDLQVVKAAGVTFVSSMLERVIEERAAGDPAAADGLREHLGAIVGDSIRSVRPGSAQAAAVKEALVAAGLWSQYLEVGIGPDPEIFTKAPVLSAVGTGARVGVLERSVWNNPEPELVLVSDGRGRALGATLGNDVNLRDIEGRSALLLGKAKDNNAACAVGPFLRLFDDGYSLDDARQTDITLRVTDRAGRVVLEGSNSVREISRPFEELLAATYGTHHRYPDGFALFTGTLFSPTQDRSTPGRGFTHEAGDVVDISADRLGLLRNVVDTAEHAPEWTFGIAALMTNLAGRGLLTGTVAR